MSIREAYVEQINDALFMEGEAADAAIRAIDAEDRRLAHLRATRPYEWLALLESQHDAGDMLTLECRADLGAAEEEGCAEKR